jgi:hypothetical protein
MKANIPRDQEIIKKYQAGETIYQLADVFGITKQRIHQILKTNKIESCKPIRAQKKLDKIKQHLSENKRSYLELAEELGFNVQTIKKIVKKHDLYDLVSNPHYKNAEERFWSYVIKLDDDGCWIMNPDKYKIRFFRFQNKYRTIQQISWYLKHNYYAPLLRLRCKNKKCVNPNHMLPSDPEKMLEAANKRKQQKLNPKKVHASVEERFAYYLDKPDANGCVTMNVNLYISNAFLINKQFISNKKAAWFIAHGYFPEKLKRTCKNRKCINPEHMTEHKKDI